MYEFINSRHIPGGGVAVLYRKQGGGFTVTVFQDSPAGVNYDFKTRRAAVTWRQTLRKI